MMGNFSEVFGIGKNKFETSRRDEYGADAKLGLLAR
jgi:hypothetical protein